MNILLQSYNKFTKLAKKTQKNALFFQKYLVVSKKSSTFAPAFEKEHVFLAQLV